jgi:hypothetical protein
VEDSKQNIYYYYYYYYYYLLLREEESPVLPGEGRKEEGPGSSFLKKVDRFILP